MRQLAHCEQGFMAWIDRHFRLIAVIAVSLVLVDCLLLPDRVPLVLTTEGPGSYVGKGAALFQCCLFLGAGLACLKRACGREGLVLYVAGLIMGVFYLVVTLCPM